MSGVSYRKVLHTCANGLWDVSLALGVAIMAETYRLLASTISVCKVINMLETLTLCLTCSEFLL